MRVFEWSYGCGCGCEYSRVMTHEDVLTWQRFPRYWHFVRRIDRSSVSSQHKRTWNAELWWFRCCYPEYVVEQTSKLSVIFLDAMTLMWRHCNGCHFFVSHVKKFLVVMTSSNGNIFRVYQPFVRGIHRSPVNSQHKVRDAELWYFLWSAPD